MHGLTVSGGTWRRCRYPLEIAPSLAEGGRANAEGAIGSGSGCGGGGSNGAGVAGGAQACRAAAKGKLPMLSVAASFDAPQTGVVSSTHPAISEAISEIEMTVQIAGAQPPGVDAAGPSVKPPTSQTPAAAPSLPTQPAAGAVGAHRCGEAWKSWWEMHFATVNAALSALLVGIVVVLVGAWM